MTTVIRAENLGKKYLIRHEQQGRRFNYNSLGETLANGGKALCRRLLHPFSSRSKIPTQEEFWALKDIDFEIQQGDRVGIIGRNGAGKSTLLKILSRITKPTTGQVRIKGRVASLLEIGTGFHPELTGRENIYLNGAILGMRRKEIAQKFDEIVDFAEVEKFLDTPVKHYSSGMYVRLAFAVAAHLEPDILVVDEVLAVGDVQFQKKCLGKMEEVANAGRTILLVSHNMPTIQSLSKKVILLLNGLLIHYGETYQVLKSFQDSFTTGLLGQTELSSTEHYGNGVAKFRSIHIRSLDELGNYINIPLIGCDLEFSIEIEAYQELHDIRVDLAIYDNIANRLIDVSTLIKGVSVNLTINLINEVKFLIKNVRLKPGEYTVGLWMGITNMCDIDGVRYATSFKMAANRENILFTTSFPGVYSCEFECYVIK